MKTERRQELRTNELAQMIEDAREFFRAWGSYVLGGVVVVGLVVAFAVYRAKAADEQLAEAWKSLQSISFLDAKGEKKPDAELQQKYSQLRELAAEDRGPDFLLEVLSSQANWALRLASSSKDGRVDTVWLDRAAEAFEAMRTRLPDNRLAVAMALNGLANIEANRFVVDGDASRKKKASELLERLKDDPRFLGSPFQRAALERINRLDEVFRRVEFAAAPPPPVVPPMPQGPTPLLPPDFTPEQPPAATPQSASPDPEATQPEAAEPEAAEPEAVQPEAPEPTPAPEPESGAPPESPTPPDTTPDASTPEPE